MATLIQQLTNVVNIIDTSTGEIQTALSIMCVAVPHRKGGSYDDYVQIMDIEGRPAANFQFIPGTTEVQDNGGAAAPFVGTLDDLVNKLNDEYFVLAVSSGPVVGMSTEAKQDDQITQETLKEIGVVIDLTSDDSGNWGGFPLDLDPLGGLVIEAGSDGIDTIFNLPSGSTTPANAQQLANLLNNTAENQGLVRFSVPAAGGDQLLMTSGSVDVSDIILVKLVDLSVGDLEYTSFTPTAATAESNSDQIVLELVKAVEILGALSPKENTPQLLRVTDATGSPINKGAKYVSVYNAGAANGDFNGDTIKPGERITLPVIGYNTYPQFTFDGTGTELVIQVIR